MREPGSFCPIFCCSAVNKERALEWLGKAFDDHSLEMIFLKVDPRFDRLYADRRFDNLLRRMRLPL